MGSNPIGTTKYRVCGVMVSISHCHCEGWGSSPPCPANGSLVEWFNTSVLKTEGP